MCTVTHSSITITITLELNKALVEHHTQGLLSEQGESLYHFDIEQIAHAWESAVEVRLERLAGDSDRFLGDFALVEQFFQKIGI